MIRQILQSALLPLVASGLLTTLSGPASAQAWRLVPTDAQNSRVLAVTSSSGGATVARCDAGVFSVAMVLPAALTDAGPDTTLQLRFDGGPAERAVWTLTGNRAGVVSQQPARLGRRLLAGGRLELSPAETEDWNTVYGVDLPADSSSLAELMSGCRTPLEDARDTMPVLREPIWTQRPSGNDLARLYPNTNLNGHAVVLCVMTSSGRPEDCEVIYETPPGGGFGSATLSLTPQFRMDRRQAGEAAGSLVKIPVRWIIH